MNKNIDKKLLNHFNNHGTIKFIITYKPYLLNDNNPIVKLLSLSNLIYIQRLDKEYSMKELGDELIISTYLDKHFKMQFQLIWLSKKQVNILIEIVSNLPHSYEDCKLNEKYLEFIKNNEKINKD